MSSGCYNSQGLSFVVGLTIIFQVSVLKIGAGSGMEMGKMEDSNNLTGSTETTVTLSSPLNSQNLSSPKPTPPSLGSSVSASSDNQSAVILADSPSSVQTDNQSTTLSPLLSTFNSEVEQPSPSQESRSVTSSDRLTTSFAAISATVPWYTQQSATSEKERNPVFTVTSNRVLAVTSYYVDNNSTTANDTALASGSGGSSLPVMAICISVSLGALAVIIVIITVTCVCCRRHRKKLRPVSLHSQRRSEASNDYENLDTVTEFMDGVIPRRRDVRVYPDMSGGIHLRPRTMWPNHALLSGLTPATDRQVLLNDYRQLNEHLLTLKRTLENFFANDSAPGDLTIHTTSTSSKMLDIIWQRTGNVGHRRRRVVPPLRSFAYEILNSNVFIFESLMSLRLQVATLLHVFPVNGNAPIINQCLRSLESVSALLEIGMETVSCTSLVKSGYNDVLLDANPLFRELLGQLTIIRLRLESYHLLDACIEPDDVWKSRLLECLAGAESAIAEVFSDVASEHSSALEPEPAGTDENFHQLLNRRLIRFRESTDPVMPQVRRFLQGIDGNAAYYLSITLGEIGQLASNILDPRTTSALSEDDELNLELIYQNLTSVYDLTHRNNFSFSNQGGVDFNLAESTLSIDLGPMQNDDNEDIYEESPGTLHAALEDFSSSYDEDCFEVPVDRTSTSCLENVLLLYKSTQLDQLQRSIRVSFVGEAGLDGGALSREFFFMSFNSMIGQPFLSHMLFEGSRGHLLPAIDHVLTDSKGYWFVGVLIAQAVNKGCKGLPGLCDAVRHFLSHGAKIKNIGESLEKVTAEDIANGELKMVIEKVERKESLTEEERSVFENWASDSNFSKVLSPTTELEAVQRIFAHYVFNSRMTQLQAIYEGINDILTRNDQTSEIERMFPIDEKLSYDDLMSGILMEPSNDCQRKVHEYFKRFCQELHSGEIAGLTLELLLQFFTGAPYYVSMAGAQVRFAEPQEKNSFPVAHACASELVLPTVHADYDSFRCAMVKALEYSGTGFGIV